MITQERMSPQAYAIIMAPINVRNQEERIRAALGVVHGSLPEVQTKWLQLYYKHLSAHLSLPFDAIYAEDIVGYRQLVARVTVIMLLPPDECGKHEELSLLCRVRRGNDDIEVPLADVEVRVNAPNFQLIEDYWYWFWNWRFDPKI